MVLGFIIRNVLDETKASGVKLVYDHHFHSPTGGQHKFMNVLDLTYVDDLAVTSESMTQLEDFIRVFETIAQTFSVAMNVKETVVMSLEEAQQDTRGRLIKGQIVNQPNANMKIRNEKTEKTESFIYLGRCIIVDQKMVEEVRIRISSISDLQRAQILCMASKKYVV